MNERQYLKARLYLAFRSLVVDKNKPPEPAECLLYEMTFAYQRGSKV